MAVIADDLAGACDTGVEFLPVFGSPTVQVDSDAHRPATGDGQRLAVWNTESRALTPDDAMGKVSRAASRACGPRVRVVLKKTDSAFRGNFAHELRVLVDQLRPALCVIAPALPELGRTTREGVQRIDGVPIAETFYRDDPKQPVRSSFVPAIIEEALGTRIVLLDLASIRAGRAASLLAAGLAGGSSVFVADGETQEDLNRVVEPALRRAGPILFVGGNGVGRALARHCVRSARSATAGPAAPGGSLPEGKILIVCGTLHPRSRLQLKRLRASLAIDPFYPGAADLEAGFTAVTAGEASAPALMEYLRTHEVGLLASPDAAQMYPERIETALTEIVRAVSSRVALRGLMLTGGSVAYAVVRGLGIGRLQLGGRLAAGTVICRAPERRNMAICVKGGSLGEEEALVRFIRAVR